MSAREWVLPLVLGALAAGGVLLWPALDVALDLAPGPEGDLREVGGCLTLPRGQARPPECRALLPDTDRHGVPLDAWGNVGWPFPDPPVSWLGPDGTVRTSTQLVVAEDLRPGMPCLRNSTRYESCADFDWATDHVGTVEVLHHPQAAACGFQMPCQGGHPYLSFQLDETGPFVGVDGHDAVEVTLYVFNEDGELVASNAGATERNRFRLYGDFVTVSNRPWYLGDGPTPEGMRVPEGYVEFARSRLEGLPVGAVATAHVPTHEYDWLTGPLWVTVRVDGLP